MKILHFVSYLADGADLHPIHLGQQRLRELGAEGLGLLQSLLIGLGLRALAGNVGPLRQRGDWRRRQER